MTKHPEPSVKAWIAALGAFHSTSLPNGLSEEEPRLDFALRCAYAVDAPSGRVSPEPTPSRPPESAGRELTNAECSRIYETCTAAFTAWEVANDPESDATLSQFVDATYALIRAIARALSRSRRGRRD